MNALIVFLSLVLSDPARVTLQSFAVSPTEQLGCMIGAIEGDSLKVSWIRPLQRDVTTRTVVTTHDECPNGTLGRVHSHPDAKFCWYVFPGTVMPTSDGVSFVRFSAFPIDAIVCGSKLVWVDRNLNQHEQAL